VSHSILPFVPPLAELPCATPMERRFQDAGGTLWRVYERVDGECTSLVFETMAGTSMPIARRVQHFPANWCALEAFELTTLSWGS